MQALRRQISSNSYVPENPLIVPIREDKRYRSWTEIPAASQRGDPVHDGRFGLDDRRPEGDRPHGRLLARHLAQQPIRGGRNARYIIHDAAAKEVDEETFYHTRESGGTRISSAYKVAADLIAGHFPPSEWNIYCFQFSDGDNWGEDNEKSLRLLRDSLLPRFEPVLLGQVESPYGSGEFIRSLAQAFGETPRTWCCRKSRIRKRFTTCSRRFRKGKVIRRGRRPRSVHRRTDHWSFDL